MYNVSTWVVIRIYWKIYVPRASSPLDYIFQYIRITTHVLHTYIINLTQISKIQSRFLPSKKADDKRFVKWAEWTWYWQQTKSKQEKRQWDFMFVGWVRSDWPEIAVLKALISSPDFVLKHTIQVLKEMVGQDIFSILL